ncbi:MAG: sugar O-acetyltransferase [bacterium]|nr:sugar O-acetyltransferase [bacterium]
MEKDNRYRRDHEMAYRADESMKEEQFRAKRAIRKYNERMPFEPEKARECLEQSGIQYGKGIYLEPPFYCEYGTHIEIGENFYANTGCVMLDVGKITIGKNVQFGPSVSIYTAGHPIHPESRDSGYEYGIAVTIGDSVWVGGNSVILPGVKIGNNVVIGAGSVVTRDIPDNVCAAGNPCRVIREITEKDRPYYFKNRRFDAEAWEDMGSKNE